MEVPLERGRRVEQVRAIAADPGAVAAVGAEADDVSVGGEGGVVEVERERGRAGGVEQVNLDVVAAIEVGEQVQAAEVPADLSGAIGVVAEVHRLGKGEGVTLGVFGLIEQPGEDAGASVEGVADAAGGVGGLDDAGQRIGDLAVDDGRLGERGWCGEGGEAESGRGGAGAHGVISRRHGATVRGEGAARGRFRFDPMMVAAARGAPHGRRRPLLR